MRTSINAKRGINVVNNVLANKEIAEGRQLQFDVFPCFHLSNNSASKFIDNKRMEEKLLKNKF